MKRLPEEKMIALSGGLTNHCGNAVEAAVFIQTCSLAGGLIGLAFGGVGAAAGSLLGGIACHFGCYH